MDDLAFLKKKLFPYAYNILGNIQDSDDVLQEVFIKYNEKSAESISHQQAYLIRAVVNGSINLKKKNDRERRRKVTLPEPIVTNQGESDIELKEILTYSLLVLLDRLNAKERAVFLLKEGFDYGHDEIAEILSISVDNSRQLLSRAKKKVLAGKSIPRPPNGDSVQLKKYLEAIRGGDVSLLEQMLSDEVQVLADGGDKLRVVAELTTGISDTVKLITYLYDRYQKDFEINVGEINHQPALLFYLGPTLINCQVFALGPDEKITHIFSVVDPGKLARI